MTREIAAQDFFGFCEHRLQRLLQVRFVVRNADDTDLRALPAVLIIEFRHGYVIPRLQPVFQAAQYLALIFQGTRIRNVNFEDQETDGHFPAPWPATSAKKFSAVYVTPLPAPEPASASRSIPECRRPS